VKQRDTDLPARHRAEVADGMFSAVRRLTWSADRLAAERQRRLRELLAWSSERSPFHAERLAGIDVEQFTEADLASIPIMTRTDVMGDFDRVVTDPALTLDVVNEHLATRDAADYLLDEYQVVATSGTTGARSLFVYGWDAWTTFVLAATRWRSRDGNTLPLDAPTASLFAWDATHVSGALHAFFRNTSDDASPPLLHLAPTLPLPEIVAALNASPPLLLQGYPSSVHLLAVESLRGRLQIRPERVVTCGEHCTNETRSVVADAWGVEIYDYWGCSEGAYAFPCAAGTGMHLPDDLVIVEPVDSEGKAVANGEPAAKILLTNLYNPTQPLIRYEIADAMTIVTDTCQCGCAHRRITHIAGRTDTFFAYEGDAIVHSLGVDTTLLHEGNLVSYQVTQTPRGMDIRILTKGACDVDGLRRGIVDLCTASGLADPQVTIREVDSLERLWSGKLQMYQPL
jgi:phenylacetate-coenzyme A ligase PaaK-like adenylate-forming protein